MGLSSSRPVLLMDDPWLHLVTFVLCFWSKQHAVQFAKVGITSKEDELQIRFLWNWNTKEQNRVGNLSTVVKEGEPWVVDTRFCSDYLLNWEL
ncbi:hypothetical protein Tco_1191617 [Tanacetum coccineum]